LEAGGMDIFSGSLGLHHGRPGARISFVYIVIPGRRVSVEPGISRFPDAQLRISGLVLRTIPA
jgi:hypothetical protein